MLALLAPFARTDGCTVRDHIRRDVMELQRPREKESLLARLALRARTDGCLVRDHLRRDVMALHRS